LSGLDPVGRLEMKEIMLDLRKAGKTVFFSSHIVPDVEEICDRVIFLRLGKLIYDGSVDRLMKENLRQSFWITLPSSFQKNETSVIRSEKLNEELTRWEVAAENKDKFILELAKASISIQGVSQDRPSLEEIFYHIRS
jgi:ABC-2 type transport system ATP-binding protein